MSRPCILETATFPLQAADPAFSWTYFWLAVGGLMMILALLAFGYLVVRREWDLVRRMLRSSLMQRVDRVLSDHVPWLWTFIRRRFRLKEWHGLALTIAFLVSFAAVYGFAIITESWVEQEALYEFDRRVYDWLVATANAEMVSFMRMMTHFGDGVTVTVINAAVGGLMLAYKRRWEVVSLVLSVGVGSGVMHGLKWIFERSRPAEQVVQVAGHSFPSGHAFMATTLYGWLIFLTWRLVRGDIARIGATMALTFIIFLTGVSRIILRVHWTSDVAGGFTVGLAWLVCSLVLTQVLRIQYAGRSSTSIDDVATE